MNIIGANKIDLSLFGKTGLCDLYRLHVKIDDINSIASNMIISISDNCWINKLDAVSKMSFTARAQGTVKKIVDDILSCVDNLVTSDFGEYLVSYSTQQALSTTYNHNIIPLAELWKEKVTGNPGFDFHTESLSNLIFFGEAKYNKNQTPHTIALNQISSFIKDKKDDMELVDLKHFVNEGSIENAVNGKRGYVAAFSLSGKDFDKMFKTAIESDAIDNLLHYPEVFLVGIEI